MKFYGMIGPYPETNGLDFGSKSLVAKRSFLQISRSKLFWIFVRIM